MAVSTTYTNMDEFMLPLSQHAINHELEFKTEKSIVQGET